VDKLAEMVVDGRFAAADLDARPRGPPGSVSRRWAAAATTKIPA
jgi:hypothetical protein